MSQRRVSTSLWNHPPNDTNACAARARHPAFQIDAFSGTPRGNRVYTDLSGPLGQAAELPPTAVRSAQLIHRRLGAPPAGAPYDVYLCHVFCELGAVRMLDEMQVVRDFLDAHPREVLVMVIEDYVAPEAILDVLHDAGLESELLPVDPGAPLPTLEQMIERGTRVQVSLENGALAADAAQRVHRPGGGDAVHVPAASAASNGRRRASCTEAPTARRCSSSTTGSPRPSP